MLGVGLIVPLTPYIVEQFDSSNTAVGILTLAYSAAQFLATPVLGVLSDRFGRRPVLFFSVLGSAAGYVLFALAHAYPLLVIARAIDGITGGNISTAQAYIADVTPPEQRAKSYGLIGAAFGLGFTLGPAFSGLLGSITPMAPVWAAAGLSLFTAALVFVFLPETLAPSQRTRGAFRVSQLNPFLTLAAVLRIPLLASLIAAVFCFNFAHAELRTSFGVLLRDKFHFAESDTSWMFAYMGLLAVLVQGGLVRRIVPWLGERRTALVGMPIAVIGYMLLPFAHNAIAVGGALTILALGGGLAGPVIPSMLSASADPQQQGTVLGASQAVAALALVLGPLAAGQLYDRIGDAWPFWTGALMVVVSLVIIAIRAPRSVRAPHAG